MVLAELGQRMSHALAGLSSKSVVDEAALDACLKEICTALLQGDVNVRQVAALRANVKKRVQAADDARGLSKQRIVEKVRTPGVGESGRGWESGRRAWGCGKRGGRG